MLDMEEVGWVEKAIERSENLLDTLDEYTDPVYARRLKVWDLRVKGYSVVQIASLIDCSVGTAHADYRWCLDNLPAAYETQQDFRVVTMLRLDEMIQRLQANPTDAGDRTIIAAEDMQAKLLGAYAPTRVDANIKTQYQVVGINPEEI